MKEKKKSITMKDVALEAGVSVGTVSRVINKEQGIKEVTLKKVQQAIEKLSYVPDEYARGLKRIEVILSLYSFQPFGIHSFLSLLIM